MITERLPPTGNGCEHHADCLTCPFDLCVFEFKGGLVGYNRWKRRQRYAILRKTGQPVKKLAEWAGVHKRTVYRNTGEEAIT